jgi:hypothetical protein
MLDDWQPALPSPDTRDDSDRAQSRWQQWQDSAEPAARIRAELWPDLATPKGLDE